MARNVDLQGKALVLIVQINWAIEARTQDNPIEHAYGYGWATWFTTLGNGRKRRHRELYLQEAVDQLADIAVPSCCN